MERRGWKSHDPERALVRAVRWAVFPTLCAPLACASAMSGVAGQGLPLAVAAPLAVLTLIVSAACWLKVIVLWRNLPQGGDDDQGWWRRRRGGAPLDPGGGGGGISFDWAAFEHQFWSHVARIERERERERELVHACAAGFAIIGPARAPGPWPDTAAAGRS